MADSAASSPQGQATLDNKKNFIAFLFLSMGVLMLSNMLFAPPPQPQPKDAAKKPAAAADGEKDQKAGADAKLSAGPDASTDDEENPEGGDANATESAEDTVKKEDLQFVTLGSLDQATGYRMLVTFTNEGAAVKRAELSSPRFLDLVDRSGYLGHLEFDDTTAGPKVRVVGGGTPAEQAGVKVGDVITGLERTKGKMLDVKSGKEFHEQRAKTKPGRDITLRLIRDGGEPQTVTVKLVRRPLEVVRPEIDNIRMRDGKVPPGFVDPPSYLLDIATVGDINIAADAEDQLAALIKEDESLESPKAKSLREAIRLRKWLENGNWTVSDAKPDSVTFERPLPQHNLKLTKTYKLEPAPEDRRDDVNYPGYNLTLNVTVENTGDAEQSVAYRLNGANGLPMEGWWYSHKISRDHWFAGAGLRDAIVRYEGQKVIQFDGPAIGEDGNQPMGQAAPLAYVGVDGVYFSAVMIPVKAAMAENWIDTTEAIRVGPKPSDDTPMRFTNVSCRLTTLPATIAPKAADTKSYTLFMGPKRPELLSEYKAANDPVYSLRDIIFYGMWPFGAVARGMLAILHFFYSIVGNFGIAIIMLTVVVRGAMFPISFKQTQNMARMQALKPELDRINEKYKTDMQKRSQAMQELYRKHKINPLGGCLPVFLQLPIFMGLYRSIMIDVELRQTPLFSEAIQWCSDLSAPDMLYNWSWLMPRSFNSGEGILALGPYFNVLPIVTVILFLVSMKFSMPEPTNEQAVMQQKMMKYMTGFMGLMFYKVASGLCLYFIASSLWGLGERRLLKKSKNGDGTAVAAPPTPPRDNGRSSSNGTNGAPNKREKDKRKR
jgi:YidC/Oxa1 family membrane protein insertase